MNNQNTPQAKVSQPFDLTGVRDFFKQAIKKWYWFVISIFVCLVLAFMALKKMPEKYKIKTSILLRESDNRFNYNSDMPLLDAIGFTGMTKEVEDETEVLKSKTLLRNAIDSLGIQNEYYVKRGWRYVELYKQSPIAIVSAEHFNDFLSQTLIFTIKPQKNDFKIQLKIFSRDTVYTVNTLSKPIKTFAGVFSFRITGALEENASYRIIVNQTKSLVDTYASLLQIVSKKKSNVISITLKHACAQKAEDLLNKMIDLYYINDIEDKNRRVSDTKHYVDLQVKEVKEHITEIDKAAEIYKKNNFLTDMKTDIRVYRENSSDYEKQRVVIQAHLKVVNDWEAYLQNENNQYDMISVAYMTKEVKSDTKSLGAENNDNDTYTRKSNAAKNTPLMSASGIFDDTFLRLVDNYNSILLQRQQLLRSAGKDNPLLNQYDEQLKAIRSNILVSISNIKNSIQVSLYEIAQKDDQFRQKIKDIPTQEREYTAIERDQKVNEDLYRFLLQKQKETELSLSSTLPAAKTLDRAISSAAPVSPNHSLIWFAAFLIGCFIPVFIIYVMEMFDNKIRVKADLKILNEIPFVGIIGINKTKEKLVVGEKTSNLIAEMFRIVRTNIQFILGRGHAHSVITVTSNMSGEGKTFVAMNLAMSLALTKKKTALVGLDIRNPKLSEFLNLPNRTGASIFLNDDSCTLQEITTVAYERNQYLDVITAGPVPPNPSELLMSGRLDELFAALREKYDYVVVDSAPIALVSDTQIISKLADLNIFIVRQDYTPKNTADSILELYNSKKIEKMAILLNCTDSDLPSYGHGIYYAKR